jgi:hypothetical protein
MTLKSVRSFWKNAKTTLACARGSESGSRVQNHLPSQERQVAVMPRAFQQALRSRRSLLTVSITIVTAISVWVCPHAAWAQANSATFYATVIDTSGAVIPGARVTLTDVNTQAKMNKVTSGTGEVAFTFVPVGTYSLSIDASGFKSFVSTGITLTAGQQAQQTFKLEVGQASETVTVEGAAPLVNTVSAQQVHNYSLTDARELPLQNRNFTGLLKINAGVVPSQGNNGTGVNMNGVGRNGTVYSLDGTNASGNSGSNNPGT